MATSACALDEEALRVQLQRYREAGRHGAIAERTASHVVVRIDAGTPDQLIEELIATERACCPFFALDWDPSERTLSIAVTEAADEPALAVLAAALTAGGELPGA
jgi:hypothetical protein